MRKIVEGVNRFRSDVFGAKQRLFEGLVGGQSPLALFITCSDSRIDPNLMTQTEPGELFVLRNAGNIVPPYGMSDGGAAATIEYAVSVLGVSDIVICGHSHCGAMGGLLDQSQLGRLPAVRSWLSNAEATFRIVEENFSDVTDPMARLTAAVEQNVLVQLANLKTHPTVAAAVGRGALQLHGWVYRFETGEISGYHPDRNGFAAIDASDLTDPDDGVTSA